MNELHTAGSTVLNSLTTFFAFLPTLIGAILILILGWVIALLLAKLIEKVLVSVGFERAVHHSGIGHVIESLSAKLTTSKLVAQLAKWFVFLIFVQAAANLLHMPQITAVINSIILYIPRVIVAIALVILGVLAGKFIAGILDRNGSPHVLSTLANYAVVASAFIAAVDQLGIATTVVNTLFIGLVAAMALAAGLAFGLGGRDTAAKITQSWYEGGKKIAEASKKEPSRPSGTTRVFTSE